MASNLLTRLLKLEQANGPASFVVIAVDDTETNEAAYQRCFADGVKPKPKLVIYCSELDARL